MFNIIYAEFLKLKKSYLVIIALVAAVFIPVLQCIQVLSTDYIMASKVLSDALFMSYRVDIEVVCFQFLYIVIFSLIAGYIFSREFSDKTANVIFVYPFSRIKIFMGKLFTVYAIIAFTYIIGFVAAHLTLYISWGRFASIDMIIVDIKVNLWSMLAQFLIVLIPIMIANFTKNIIIPVVYGIIAAVSSAFVMLIGIYMQIDPLMLAALPVYHFYIGDPIDFVLVALNVVITFIVFMSLCLYQYANVNID